tara:strand:+ start:89 stop:424 length:336 start_codon:yes stop_codon:yes gene_type:complete
MAIISNGTTVASGGSLQNIPSPSNSQILAGVASAGANVVGSYASLYNHSSFSQHTHGQTQGINGSNDYRFATTAGSHTSNSYPSGTWRCMGWSYHQGGNRIERVTIWLRIS